MSAADRALVLVIAIALGAWSGLAYWLGIVQAMARTLITAAQHILLAAPAPLAFAAVLLLSALAFTIKIEEPR